MGYDYRELIFRDLQLLSPEDPFYFSRRFRKAKLILTKEEVKQLDERLSVMKEDLGFQGQSLDYIERKLRTSKAIKIRTEKKLIVVPRERAVRRLNEVDDWLDLRLKKKATEIRWSNTSDLVGRSQNLPK